MPADFRRLLVRLLAGALFLPIGLLLILGVARLLAALGDAAGAAVFDRIALFAGVAWLFVIFCLPIVLALRSLTAESRSDDEPLDDER